MEIMDNARKRNMGIWSFAPLAAFVVWLVYYLLTLREVLATGAVENHFWISSEMGSNYTGLLIGLMIVAVLGTIVLIQQIVHIARIKDMNAAVKTAWILFLSTFNIVAFPFFWFIEIRNEPRELDTYPDIA